MTNIFKDQKSFMTACDQSIDKFHSDQFTMYTRLINEECTELAEAIAANDNIEILDALIDILVVTAGAIASIGADGEGAWNEVIRSNMSKIDAATGKVLKREDGKVLKPESFSPPVLEPFLTANR
jgi:predicted HAD superfamily Cof-like phosphohydrolase